MSERPMVEGPEARAERVGREYEQFRRDVHALLLGDPSQANRSGIKAPDAYALKQVLADRLKLAAQDKASLAEFKAAERQDMAVWGVIRQVNRAWFDVMVNGQRERSAETTFNVLLMRLVGPMTQLGLELANRGEGRPA